MNELELRRRYMSRLPFCPDHRDKVQGKACRECEIERLKAERDRLKAEVEEMASLFQKHRDDFGCCEWCPGDIECADGDRLIEFEDKFVALICKSLGHEFAPDQCNKPEHDLCYRCNKLASDLGYERDGQGGYREKTCLD